jgi:hypothetical protein
MVILQNLQQREDGVKVGWVERFRWFRWAGRFTSLFEWARSLFTNSSSKLVRSFKLGE